MKKLAFVFCLTFSLTVPVLGELLTNAVFQGRTLFKTPGTDDYSLTLDRGSAWLPAARFAHESSDVSGGVYWTEGGTSDEGPVGRVACFENWGGVPGNGTLLLSSRNIRLENGWWSSGGYISLGNEDQMDGTIIINYTPLRTNAAGTDFAYYDQPGLPNETGVGIPLAFAVHACDIWGTNWYAAPGIQSHGVPQGDGSTIYGVSGDTRSLGELWFYSGLPVSVGAPDFYDAYPGVVVGRMLTNGWDFRGKLIRERVASSTPSASVGLNFGLGYCVDLSLAASSVRFYSTNTTGCPTNFEPRIFILRAGHHNVACTWPAKWSWTTSIPSTITNGALLRLQLESLGPGEANIIANALVAKDNSPPLDLNGDGIPDTWELAYGLDPTSAEGAAADPDNDKLTNLEEYQLGLNPMAPDLPTVQPHAYSGTGGFGLFVQEMFSRAGTLEVSTNLSDWQTLEDLPAGSTRSYYTDPSATNVAQRFYRIVVR